MSIERKILYALKIETVEKDEHIELLKLKLESLEKERKELNLKVEKSGEKNNRLMTDKKTYEAQASKFKKRIGYYKKQKKSENEMVLELKRENINLRLIMEIKKNKWMNDIDRIEKEVEKTEMRCDRLEKAQMARDTYIKRVGCQQRKMVFKNRMAKRVKDEMVRKLRGMVQQHQRKNMNMKKVMNDKDQMIEQLEKEKVSRSSAELFPNVRDDPTNQVHNINLNRLSEQLVSLADENFKLKEQMEADQTEKGEFTRRLKQVDQHCGRLIKDNTTLFNHNRAFFNELSALKQQMKAAQIKHGELTNRLQLAKTHSTKLINDNKKLFGDHTDMLNELAKLKTQIVVDQIEKRELIYKLQQVDEHCAKLINDNNTLFGEHTVVLNEVTELKKQLGDAEIENVKLRDGYIAGRLHNIEMKGKLDEKDEQLKKARADIRELKLRLKK